MISTSQQHTLSIAILGTDTVLAVRPAGAIQLAHAVLRVGYDAVYPVTWGDELVAAGCLQRLTERDGGSVVLCACPLVSQRLLRNGEDLAPLLMPLVSPPVAVARYLRALHEGRLLHITYMGSCPDAHAAEIDARLSPDELEGELRARGILVTRQPQYFESVLPPDRRRFYSLPGGVPAPNWLKAAGRARALVTLAGEDVAAELAQALLSEEPSLIDVAPVLGCVCSGAREHVPPVDAREEAGSMEPPRAPASVIDTSVPIELDRQLTTTGAAARESPVEANDDRTVPAAAADSGAPSDESAMGVPAPAVEPTPDDAGELLHAYSRPRPTSATEAPTRRTTHRTPPFVTPPASSQTKSSSTADEVGADSSANSVTSDASAASSIARTLDLLQGIPLLPGTEPLRGEQDAATGAPAADAKPVVAEDVETELAVDQLQIELRQSPADEATVPAAPAPKRATPLAVRRITASTPVVRTESGRAVPRAYAAHRRGSAGQGEQRPAEREATIKRSFEPRTPPADFRPPILPRAAVAQTNPVGRLPADASMARGVPSGSGSAESRDSQSRAQDSTRSALPPRPPSMVPHRTVSALTPRRTPFAPPPRRGGRTRALLAVLGIAVVGTLSLLAVRHLTARDQPAPAAAASTAAESSATVEQSRTSSDVDVFTSPAPLEAPGQIRTAHDPAAITLPESRSPGEAP